MRAIAVACLALLAGAACGPSDSAPPSSQPAQAAPAPPPPPPPPPPPDTPAGKLVKVERVDKVSLQIYCMGAGNILKGKTGAEIFATDSMVCKADEKPRPGHQFVVLTFEGPAKRKVGGEVVRFVSKTASEFLARVDAKDQAVLTDGAGNSYKDAMLVVEKGADGRQLVYEVPAEAANLTLKDGSEEFPLGPPRPPGAPTAPTPPAPPR